MSTPSRAALVALWCCLGCLEPLEPIPTADYPTPVKVSGTLQFSRLAAGGLHTCGLTTDGSVYCWGKSEYGELGTSAALESCGVPGGSDFTCTGTPRRVEGLPPLVSLSLSMGGAGRSCGLTAAGAAWCWGYGLGGQLGDGLRVNSATPVAVQGGLSFSSLSVGAIATCAVATDGHSYCWGANARLFGDGTQELAETPRRVSADSLPFARVFVGDAHACGLTADGRAFCWGGNWYGTLGEGSAGGNGGLAYTASPVAVVGPQRYRLLSVGGDHTCGLTLDDQTFCWGVSTFFPDLTLYVPTPTRVVTPVPFDSLYSGYIHVCGLALDGSAYCWGENYAGNLGDGTRLQRRSPSRVLSAVAFVSLSAFPSCGLAADGTAYCWGDNVYGQVGRKPGTGN